jgi:opacity protein-like surface antigen
MKKLTLSLAAVALCTTANPVLGNGVTHVEQPAPMAAPAPVAKTADNAKFAGPFLGLSLGISRNYGSYRDQMIDSTAVAANSTSNMINRGHRGESAVMGGVHFGYDHLFKDRFLVGAELYLDAVDTNTAEESREQNNIILRSKADQKLTFGAGLRGGIVHNDVLAYIGVGYVGSSWQLNGAVDLSQTTTPGSVYSFRNSEFLSGLRVSLGMGVMPTDHILLSAEGAYSWYETMKSNRNFNDAANLGARIQNVSFKHSPEVLEARVKVTWKMMPFYS